MRKRCACTHTHTQEMIAARNLRLAREQLMSNFTMGEMMIGFSFYKTLHRSRSNTAHPSPSMLILIALTAHQQRSTDSIPDFGAISPGYSNTFWCNFTRDPLCLFLYCEKRFRFCGQSKKLKKCICLRCSLFAE